MTYAAILLALGLALAPAVTAAAEPSKLVESAQSGVRPFSVARTEQFTLKAKSGRVFEISVARPSAPAPAGGYPVLYVLDPSTAFSTLADTVRNHEMVFGPAVVVGVGYPSEAEIANRSYDMTMPVDPATLPKIITQEGGGMGGADAFLAFLQDELKPVIEKSVAIDKSRQALFGHSLGGLFVLHALFTRPDSFDTYIAGSPSIWWGRKEILKAVPGFEAAQKASGAPRRLLIEVGEMEGRATPEDAKVAQIMKLTPEEMTRLIGEARMVGNAADLAERLRPLSARGLEVDYVAFPDETHNSVIPAYLSRGAQFSLRGWSNRSDKPAR